MNINAFNNKIINRIALIYGLLVGIVNYLGYLLASSGGMPIADTADYRGWIEFMENNTFLITLLSSVSFITPAALIIAYRITSKDKWAKRIINLPITYSAIGSLGWVLSFIIELCCLLFAKNSININISQIAIVSLINILQECICIFTLTFLILDFIHRKYVLPKIYPNGNLSRFSNKFKPSVKFVVYIFYLSICIFPVFFLTSTLITLLRNQELLIDNTVWITLACILLLSAIILWAFCDYLSKPIKKLKLGTQRIMDGNYGCKVDIVSNDDFGELADAFNEMSLSLEDKNNRIHAIQNSIIKGMAVMVESRDNSTGGHINRTSDCVRVFIDSLSKYEQYANYDSKYWKSIIKAAPMHDLGKIAVDDAVLRKEGRFTDEEFEKMKAHSSEGARIVENVLSQVDDESFKQITINIAHYHHEKWNGMGYPEKLKGTEIPFEARVMALADVFDALVSKRCYKESYSYDKAFEIIKDSLGTHFDPDLGRIFIECRESLEKLYDGYEA